MASGYSYFYMMYSDNDPFTKKEHGHNLSAFLHYLKDDGRFLKRKTSSNLFLFISVLKKTLW